MDLQQINPELLNKWKEKGDLIAIWKCDKCSKKLLFYKENSFIDNIILAWVHNHQYCDKCEKKIKGIHPKKKDKILRINRLLEIYEPEEYYI